MVLVRVRVTDELTDFLLEVARWCADLEHTHVYVCCQEISKKGKKHFHLLAEYRKSVSTFNRLFSKQFPQLVGNKVKSISEGTECLDVNVRYICKGDAPDKDPVVLLSNISLEDVARYHTEFWANNPQHQTDIKIQRLDQARGMLEETKAKTKTKTFMEKITQEFQDRYMTQVNIDGTIEVGRKFSYNKEDITFITKYVLKRLGNSSKILDQYIVKRMVLGLLNSVTNGDDEVLTSHLINQMFNDL